MIYAHYTYQHAQSRQGEVVNQDHVQMLLPQILQMMPVKPITQIISVLLFQMEDAQLIQLVQPFS